jgi:uncharacterized protein
LQPHVSFEWDPQKNEINKEKHGICFEDAAEVFEGAYLRVRSDRTSEIRWVALGEAQERIIAVIYTERQGRIRIISARAARTKEREIFQQRIRDTS